MTADSREREWSYCPPEKNPELIHMHCPEATGVNLLVQLCLSDVLWRVLNAMSIGDYIRTKVDHEEGPKL